MTIRQRAVETIGDRLNRGFGSEAYYALPEDLQEYVDNLHDEGSLLAWHRFIIECENAASYKDSYDYRDYKKGETTMKSLDDNALRRIARGLENTEEVFSTDDPRLIYIGDFASSLPVGRINPPIKAWSCPSDGKSEPEEVEIVGARDAHSDYDVYEGSHVSYVDLADGRRTTGTYLFPIDSKPEFLTFEDEHGTFHNWAAFK